MALNFPDSPTLNQVYTDSTSGFSYQWNGTVWISFSPSTTNNISELDDISASFNGSTTIFALTVNGIAVSPATTNQLLISVGGVMQNPTNDYYISGSNIIFTTAPTSGLTFFGILLGTAVPISYANDGNVYNRQTYAVTGVQTSFTFTSGYTVGYLDVFRNGSRLISGDDFTATNGTTFSLTSAAQNGDDVEAIGYKVSSIVLTEGNLTNLLVNQNAQVLGITTLGANVAAGQTALTVQGNARVTGILTVGSSSITLNGSTDQINVGSGLTLSSSGILAGVITATSFVGNGSGLTGAGSTVADDTSTNATFYPLFTTITSGTVTSTKVSTSKLSFNPSTGNVTATSFAGSLTGTASTATAASTAYGLTGTPNLNVGIVTTNNTLNVSNSNITSIKTASFNSQNTIATTSGSITVDWTVAQNQKQNEPTGTITYTFTAPPGPCHLQLLVDSDGSSTAQTFNWPGTLIWLGTTWTATNNKKAIINFWYDGSNYYAMGTNQV